MLRRLNQLNQELPGFYAGLLLFAFATSCAIDALDGLSRPGGKTNSQTAGVPQGASDATMIKLNPMLCDCERVIPSGERSGYGDSVGSTLSSQNDCSYVHPDGDSNSLLTLQVFSPADQTAFETMIAKEIGVDAKRNPAGSGELAYAQGKLEDQSYQLRSYYFTARSSLMIRIAEKQSPEVNARVKPISNTKLIEMMSKVEANFKKQCQ